MVMINCVTNPLISLKKAFMAAACVVSYVAEKAASVSCPADRRQEYDSCRHNAREIHEYVPRITGHPDDEAYYIAKFLDHMGDYHSPYIGYPRLMECFENMAAPGQANTSEVGKLANHASAFMGAYTRLPTRTRAALCVSLQLQKYLQAMELQTHSLS